MKTVFKKIGNILMIIYYIFLCFIVVFGALPLTIFGVTLLDYLVERFHALQPVYRIILIFIAGLIILNKTDTFHWRHILKTIKETYNS